MASGTVKWWDRRKGYGFIVGEEGQDVFVHYTTIQGEGYKSLAPGESVHVTAVDGLTATVSRNRVAKERPS